MTISKLADLADLTPVVMPDPEHEVLAGYTSDLLSDVVANCPEKALLITLQAHANTVAACAVAGAAGILVCGKRNIPEAMLSSARLEGIAILETPLNQFEASYAVQTVLLNRQAAL